jgi:peptide/nickel transport system ATP-binding protein
LLDAFPSIRGPRVPLTGIPGSPPDLAQPPAGCRFHPRCPVAFADCDRVAPELYPVGGTHARCLLHAPRPRPLADAPGDAEEVHT